MSRYLIVAYQTAGGRALRDTVSEIASHDEAAEFVLLVPATHTQHLFTWTEGESRAVAEGVAEAAATELRSAGVPLTAVRVGDADPFVAVTREFEQHQPYDSVIVSTLPPGISRWLRLDLPARLEKELKLPVVHVVVDLDEAESRTR